jgi:hypothetical protein
MDMIKQALVAVMVVLLAGCTLEASENATGQYFATSNGPVEFLFPAGWHKSKSENPYDLQCFSRFERMTTGVFLFAKEDLAEDLKPRELLQLQIDDLKSKRKNFKIKDGEHVVQARGTKQTTVVYSGEKGSSRYYYRFTLVEFDKNPEMIAVVLQVAIPSSWTKHKPILEKITKSARVRSEKVTER